MATKKVSTEIKDSKGKVVDTIVEVISYELEIMYEETMTTVKIAGQPRFNQLTKTPYLDFGGHKVYLSKEEVEGIRAGKVNPQDILDAIPVQEVYRT